MTNSMGEKLLMQNWALFFSRHRWPKSLHLRLTPSNPDTIQDRHSEPSLFDLTCSVISSLSRTSCFSHNILIDINISTCFNRINYFPIQIKIRNPQSSWW